MKPKTVNCTECTNLNCSLLVNCNQEWLKYINEKKTVLFYKKRQRIIFERGPVDGVYFLLSGKVKVYKSGNDDRQQIVRLCTDGDILGHRGINRDFYPISAMTLEDSYICMLPIEDFKFALKSNPELTYNLMLFVSEELYLAEELIKHLVQLPVREKIADALLRIKNTFNPAPSDPSLGASLTRQDIADLAGTTKEQVSRDLANFKEEGIIELDGKEIRILDLMRLKRIINVI